MISVRDIDIKRLGELEKQAALFGPHTEPAILIEIQTLRDKYPDAPRAIQDWRRRDQELDFSFLMNTVAAALKRLSRVEERDEQLARELAERERRDREDRENRQEKLDDQLTIIRDSTLANGVHLENLVKWLIGVGVVAVLGLMIALVALIVALVVGARVA